MCICSVLVWDVEEFLPVSVFTGETDCLSLVLVTHTHTVINHDSTQHTEFYNVTDNDNYCQLSRNVHN